MVSVATNFDAPIKLLWPRDIIEFLFTQTENARFTMLGLGDIVIPGKFLVRQSECMKPILTLIMNRYLCRFVSSF